MDAAQFVDRVRRGRLAAALNVTDVGLSVALGILAVASAPDDPGDEDSAEGAEAARRIAAAIDDAAGTISAAVATRYRWTPEIRSAPALLQIASDLAYAGLWGDDVPEGALEAWRSSRKRLERIAAGESRLVDAQGVPYPLLAGISAAAVDLDQSPPPLPPLRMPGGPAV